MALASEPTVVGRAVTASGPLEIRGAPLVGDARIGSHTFTTPTLSIVPFPDALPQGFTVGAQACATSR